MQQKKNYSGIVKAYSVVKNIHFGAKIAIVQQKVSILGSKKFKFEAKSLNLQQKNGI